MCKTGKEHMLDFSDEEIKKLKMCFAQIDANNTGFIGIDELEEPLIGLGIVDSKEEIQQLLSMYIKSSNKRINFDEFLLIIKNSEANDKMAKINRFFKDLTN